MHLSPGPRTLRRLTQPVPRRRHPRFKTLLPRALAVLAMLLLPALAHATPARAVAVSQGVNAVACVDTTTCYAVGDGAGGHGWGGLRTTDGSTWTPMTMPSFQPFGSYPSLGAVSCPSATTCYAAGGYLDTLNSVILATTDGGNTWTDQTQNIPDADRWPLYGIACPDVSTCFAVGHHATILATTDGGATWTSQSNPFSGTFTDLRGVACPDASTCYVVTDDSSGAILATTDGGATWTSQSTPQTAGRYLLRIACSDVSTCFAVGYSGTILATTDGGATWTDQTPNNPRAGPDQDLFGIACPDAATCYAVGRLPGFDGTILATTDGGNTWTDQTQNIPHADRWPLHGIACPATSTCYAGGAGSAGGGTILATTDGGNTWS